jgi:carbon storage regulator CsrA
MPLHLQRYPGENVRIGNDVVVSVLEVNGSQVRLGFTAPKHVSVLPGEQAKRLELGRIPPFSTHIDRLERLARAERDLPRIVHTAVSLLGTAGSETSRLQQPFAQIAGELQARNQQRSQRAARKLLEYLKYLRQNLQAQIADLSTHRAKAAAIVAPFAEVARLYDSASQQERIKQLYLADQDVGRAVDGTVALLQGANDEASNIEGLLFETVPNSPSNHLQLAPVEPQKLAELLAALPQALLAKTAELRLACSNHDTHPSKSGGAPIARERSGSSGPVNSIIQQRQRDSR